MGLKLEFSDEGLGAPLMTGRRILTSRRILNRVLARSHQFSIKIFITIHFIIIIQCAPIETFQLVESKSQFVASTVCDEDKSHTTPFVYLYTTRTHTHCQKKRPHTQSKVAIE